MPTATEFVMVKLANLKKESYSWRSFPPCTKQQIAFSLPMMAEKDKAIPQALLFCVHFRARMSIIKCSEGNVSATTERLTIV